MDAEVIIVGGGLAATALAWQCARSGVDALVLSASRLGTAGATAASRGILRLYDRDHTLMAWNVRGQAAWAALERAESGIDIKRCGLVYFLADAQAHELQQRIEQLGLGADDIELLNAAEAQRRFPALRASAGWRDDEPVLFEPRAGYCQPLQAAQALGRAALRDGIGIVECATVQSLHEDAQGVHVTLAHGQTLHAASAIVAAGAGSAALMSGLDLVAKTIPLVGLLGRTGHMPAATLPCTIDEVTSCYTRPGESTGFFYCGGAGLRDACTGDVAVATLANENLQRLSRTRSVESLAPIALYEGDEAYTTNFHPHLGFVNPYSRIGMMTGFSGRGAKYIPAAAEVVAQQVRERLRRLA